MREQDKLRRTLREYYDTRQEPLNDEEWERASVYLNAQRRKNRLGRFVFIFMVLLTAVFITLFISQKSMGNEKHPASLLSQHKIKSAKPIALHVPIVTGQKIAINSNANKEYNPSAHAAIAGIETSKKSSQVYAGHPSNKAPQVVEVEAEPQANPAGPRQSQAPVKELPQAFADSIIPTTNLTLIENKKEIPAADTVKLTPPEQAMHPAIVDTSGAAAVAITTSSIENTVGDTLPEPALQSLADEGIVYEIGAAWFYGWKGPVNRDACGFSPVAGINYMNRLSNRCALSFGVQYVQISNLSGSSKTSRVSSYIYGEQSRVTVITPSTMQYLVAPLRFHYYMDHWNSFGAGINLAYLLNVDAKVTSHDERAGFNGNYQTVKQGGYTDGFSWFDCQLAFFYRRRITGSLSLQAEVFIGLTDVKQNGFFGITNKERNSGAKLSLVYYAFRKNVR